ncbi:tyrosine-type recombinase/integrase [Mumia zhuanghuii]|uniref:tyrosine-type recombinase/integrase n=1 Tax=Mumia zhuanghuii TaxID=2585211 RepID=UPI003629A854
MSLPTPVTLSAPPAPLAHAAADNVLLVPIDRVPEASRPAVLAARFLVQYSKPHTIAAYERDLRGWFAWCVERALDPLAVRRSHIDLYVNELRTVHGASTATIARKCSTLSGYYRTAVVEDAIAVSPTVHLRRPKVPQDSQTLGLDEDEVTALLDAARQRGPRAHALMVLLAHDGLRISEALGLDVEDFSRRGKHRIATITRKGGARKSVVLTTPTWEALGELVGDRVTGPVFMTSRGGRLDRRAAGRLIKKTAVDAGIEDADKISPHSLRHTFITLALEAGVPLHRVQDAADHADPRTTQRYNKERFRIDDTHASYAVERMLRDREAAANRNDEDSAS